VSDFPEFDVPRLTEGNYLRATALLRSDVCRVVKFDEKLRTGWEDWDFFLTLAQRGLRGELLDEPLMLYRKHPAADRMSDVMGEARNRRLVKLRIMRKHLPLFGSRVYVHYLAHHMKEELKAVTTRARQRQAGSVEA